MKDPIKTVKIRFYNWCESKCVGISLKDTNGKLIAKVGSFDNQLITSTKAFTLNDGERLIGMKFSRRGLNSAAVYGIHLVCYRPN